MANGKTQNILTKLCWLRSGMREEEAALVDRSTLDDVIRALELHPCRGALVQALDRLEKVQAFKDGHRPLLPQIEAAIRLLQVRVHAAGEDSPEEAERLARQRAECGSDDE